MDNRQRQDSVARWLLGNSMVDSIIAEGGKISTKRSFKLRWRMWKRDREIEQERSHMERLLEVYLEHVWPVTAPIALISQIQFSGGSFLRSLFDGHPELHTYPYKLIIGNPKESGWPQIDFKKAPLDWFENISANTIQRDFRHYNEKMEKCEDNYRFFFIPSLQKDIFLKYLESLDTITHRDVFNAYMTSCFGAWINNQNIIGEKKYITGFTTVLANGEENMALFFKAYPEGRLISIIRDPKKWYFTAKQTNAKEYGDIHQALKQWTEYARANLRNKESYGDRICIIRFDDLICRTETVMRYLSGFLDIQYNDDLMMPTFNKKPIKINTCFKSNAPEIVCNEDAHSVNLDRNELKIIDEMTNEVFEKVLGVTSNVSQE